MTAENGEGCWDSKEEWKESKIQTEEVVEWLLGNPSSQPGDEEDPYNMQPWLQGQEPSLIEKRSALVHFK